MKTDEHYHTKGETKRLVGDKGLKALGEPDRIETTSTGNIVKLYAKSRVETIKQAQETEQAEQQATEAQRLAHIQQHGTNWERLQAGLPVNIDTPLSDGWRFKFSGDQWWGYAELWQDNNLLWQDNNLLMTHSGVFWEALDMLLANAGEYQQPDYVLGFPQHTHEIIYHYRMGAWEVIVAEAHTCTPRPPEETQRLALFPQISDFQRHYACEPLGYVDWRIEHRDGFRATGVEDDPDDALIQAVLEVGAYEDID